MKTRIASLLLLCVSFLMPACDLETSGNGNLDGYWQLAKVDSFDTAGGKDMHESGIFWSIQSKLLCIDNNRIGVRILFRFHHQGDSLTLYDPISDKRPTPDEIFDDRITDPVELEPIGLRHLEEKFLVLRLNNREMILKNDDVRMTFRRY